VVRAVLCVLALITIIAFAHAQESATKVRITPVDPAGSPIGDSFSIPCEGSRCRGPCWIVISGVSYRFEALAFFTPGYATVALEPVPNASGRIILLFQGANNPMVLPTDRQGFASRVLDLDEVAQPETRSIVKRPLLRLGRVGRIRIDVVGPRGESALPKSGAS